ncbi:MAG: TetR/AcrR family transcriptional regulator [Pikeienuella sp.]
MPRGATAKGEATVQSILAESRRLFVADGYAAVSVRMIADAVGVRVGALYNHFPTKQAILFRLMDAHMDALLAAWAAEAARHSTPAKRLAAFARFHIRYHIDRPDDVVLAYMELRSLIPENYLVIEEKRRAYEDQIKDILTAGRGQFRFGDEHLSAMAILAMLTGVTTWYRPGGRLTATEIEDEYATLVLNSVGHQTKDLAHV